MHIDVETKFEVGQEVFLIKKDRKVIENKEKCKICKGIIEDKIKRGRY